MKSPAAILLTICCPGAAFAAGPVHDVPEPANAIVLMPSAGMNIQRAVNSSPQGSTFYLYPGVYRLQSITPKHGDVFVGAYGAILNGAKVLKNFDRSGSDYVADNQPIDPNTQVHGVCREAYPRCDHPQDLYFDGVPLRAVATRSDVAPGKWFYDYRSEKIYFADDPTSHTVELSYRPWAFGGSAKNVTIQNLVIENYASADQQAAVNDHGAGNGWRILNNEVSWNHGVGIADGTSNLVARNYIHHNGEMGVAGGSGTPGVVVQNNEIAFNVWNGTDCGWECGGAKWGNVSDLRVLNNYVHDNQGDGLWTDIQCTNITYAGNDIENNLYAGISHEISGAAVIRNNTFKGNGADAFNWGWFGQIQIQNSSHVKVFGNTLVLEPHKGGNGIMIIQQNRGSGTLPEDNDIHDNDITMQGGGGAVAGWFADYKAGVFAGSNQFHDNHYHVAPKGRRAPVWAPNDWETFSQWQATGQDIDGTVN